MKLAVLTSHPIQYQTPLFKLLAENKEIDLQVFFCWKFGVDSVKYDPEFGKEIKWDIPLLDGYGYKFLKNYSLKQSSNFWGQVNFGIIVEIIKGNFDAILIFGWNSFSNWLAFLTAFLTRTPVLLRGENPLNQEVFKKKWKLFLKKIILGTLFKIVKGFLYIGEENKKFYQYYGVPEKKLFFVPYAIDNERLIKEATNNKRQEARNELGIKGNDTVILFVGKLIGKKRPFDLLKAYEMLVTNLSSHLAEDNDSIVDSSNNPILLFVGDGALRPELENYVRERGFKNVHFVGFKNQTELPKYYAGADIFVLPSGEGETWGLVVNEAMCFGLPVIISDIVGCGSDLVKNGENSFIFSLGGVKQLAEKLKELVENREKLNLFGKRSFEIIKNYSFKKDEEGILEALSSIL